MPVLKYAFALAEVRLNSFKTFLLIVLLTGLLMVLGGALYGQQGAVMAFALGALVNAFSYFFADKIVLARYRAKVVGRNEELKLYAMVESLAMRAGLPMPKVAVVPDPTPNAFATGRNPGHAVVAVTDGIMSALSAQELEAVLAHELGHVKHRDILIGCFSAALAQAIMFLSRMAMFATPRDRSGRSANPIVGLVAMLLAPIAAMMIQMAISRGREYMADEFSAKLTGQPRTLASALEKISGRNRQSPMLAAEPATAHMMIVNPLSGASLAALFSTHPPIQKRIDRLNRMNPTIY
jgi:heat shock protein HtpX